MNRDYVGCKSGPLGLYFNPLDCLIVNSGQMMPPMGDVDYAESMDAAHEDANGCLPHERGYGLGL